ncbi:MAG TPA: carbohydrate porin [Mycobacterium sp.]|nr:carbohydrate porin [Mycobacterium sp.]
MRRALLLSGLTGLLVLGVPSIRALAQEPAGPDNQNDKEESKAAAPPAALVPAPEVVPAAMPNPAPLIKPKVGDVSLSGYFRGGFGASNQKGRMTCFSLANPSGLVSKYRLGNECEVWSETHFTVVTYAGDDGVVANLHFMPTVYIPTTNIGYSPNGTVNSPAIFTTSTGATVMFPNLYVDIKGISWLAGGTPWIGTRYYKRESVYISDFFYWNPSGVGGGVEDINLGNDMRLSLAVFAVDGEPAAPSTNTSPLLPAQIDFGARGDAQLRGIRLYDGGELQLGAQYIADYSNHGSITHGGYGFTARWVHKLLGGDNRLVAQYGKGGGTGFGTLARFYYPDFSLYHNPIEARVRFVEVLTIQPIPELGAQFAGVYQRDINFLGSEGSTTNWYSAGGRISWGFVEHLKALGEAGFDRVTKSIGSQPQMLGKFTVAGAISGGRGLLTRPELRVFYTYAIWNEAARGANVDSGQIYTPTQLLSGSIFGLQAETWF